MSRCAAPRIASRVVLPSRVLAVGLGVSVGVLVVVICTNRSVQKATPRAAPRQARDRFPETKSPEIENAKHRGASRLRRDASEPPGGSGGPSRPPRKTSTEERHGSAGTLRAAPGVKGALRGPLRRTDERHGSAGTLRAARGLRGPFEAPLENQHRGASRLRRDAPSRPGG